MTFYGVLSFGSFSLCKFVSPLEVNMKEYIIYQESPMIFLLQHVSGTWLIRSAKAASEAKFSRAQRQCQRLDDLNIFETE